MKIAWKYNPLYLSVHGHELFAFEVHLPKKVGHSAF